MVHLYVLKLEQDKYYVGITQHIIERLLSHMMGEAARWTKLYPPVEVIFLRPCPTRRIALRAEDKATLIIAKHGKDVRGGRWTDPSIVGQASLLAALYRARMTPSDETWTMCVG